MAEMLDTVLLLALPASGKSEVRKYLDGMSPQQCREEFGIQPTVQLDDFPYVHMMRRIDDILAEGGGERIFFQSPERPFQSPLDWRTLIELVNEDYADLVTRRPFAPASAAALLCDRIDTARTRIGAPAALGQLKPALKNRLHEALEKEAADLLRDKQANYPESLEGRTLVIEFARGGPQGVPFPLPDGFGYQGSIPYLAPAILERAVVLYIWVTPEESRRKNEARTDPNDPGSILHHGVPIDVMLGDYGCDDMGYLLDKSGQPDTIRIGAYGREYLLPVGRFDNRVDKTSFIRDPRDKWKDSDVKAVHEGLKEAFVSLRK